jgi:hypothetical protein
MRLIVFLVACGGAGPISLALGGANDDGSGFVALGGDVDLVAGAQGGFHVWLKYRVHGLSEKVHVVRSAVRADGKTILNALPLAQMISEDFESDALPSFMCPTPVGVQVYDQTVELKLELRDDQATLAEASAQVVPRCPPDDDFCRRICGG